jgi:hypothetical protein
MSTIKTNAIRAYMKRKQGSVVLVQDWGLILSAACAIHKDNLESDLTMAFDLPEESQKRQVLSNTLRLLPDSILFHNALPNVITALNQPDSSVECYQTPLLYQVGEKKKKMTTLQVFRSDMAVDKSRKIMLIDQDDLALLGFNSDVVAPKNGSLPLIADQVPNPKKLATAFSEDSIENLVETIGSLLALIPKPAGLGFAA